MRSLRLVILTLANSGAGFLLQVVLAKRFGVGPATDAYFRALAAPLFFVGLFTAQATFRAVPALMSRELDGSVAWLDSARSFFAAMAVFGVASGVLGAIGWPPGLLWPGQGAESRPALTLLCWTYGAAQFPLVAISAILQSTHRYAAGLVVMGIPQFFTILTVLAAPGLDITAVPAVLAGGTLAVVIPTSVALLGSPWRARNQPRTRSRFGARILLESPFTAATLACFSLYSVIDAALLPAYAPGFLTTASFCQRLVIGLGQLVIAAPLTLITKDLVESVAARDPGLFRKTMRDAIAKVMLQASLLAAFLYVSAPIVMKLALTSRARPEFDVAIAASTLRYMLPGMVFMLASNILVRGALAIPGLVRRTWWLGVAWGAFYVTTLLALSSRSFNGSGIAYSASWALGFAILVAFLGRNLTLVSAGSR